MKQINSCFNDNSINIGYSSTQTTKSKLNKSYENLLASTKAANKQQSNQDPAL